MALGADAPCDVLVVGGGLAGLTAALFAARAGCATVLLVRDIPGGQLATIDRVEDFPGFPAGVAGYELGPTLQEQAASAGAEFRLTEALRLDPGPGGEPGWVVGTGEGELSARTVIIASGSHPRALGVPGEERLRGRGVSHCASCDAPLLRGQPVVVVGAGDSGLQEALTLADSASEIRVIHRSAQPTAQAVYQRRVSEQPKIGLQGQTLAEEILGEQTVSGLRIRDLTTGATDVLPATAVFVYVGLEPNTGFLGDLLALDADGRIPVDVWMRTARPGLFAAGDVRSDSAGQAITAAGDGATAAVAAQRYLASGRWRAPQS